MSRPNPNRNNNNTSNQSSQSQSQSHSQQSNDTNNPSQSRSNLTGVRRYKKGRSFADTLFGKFSVQKKNKKYALIIIHLLLIIYQPHI